MVRLIFPLDMEKIGEYDKRVSNLTSVVFLKT